MKWDPTIAQQIAIPFESGDAEEFRRLLRQYPAYLRYKDGSDLWMWLAATRGKLSMLEVLVELGMDVNESKDAPKDDPDDPFYAPEGPIPYAASNGQIATVRWLLDRGARINYVVHGQARCLPLEWAATNGHLEVVKLLVEHGADFQATQRGFNAITQAEDYGQIAVRDYLRSLGARTLRETTPLDYPSAHQRLLQHLTREIGPPSDWQMEIPGEPLVTLRLIPAKKFDYQTLVTVGLSDHRLPRGPLDHACTELRCLLAPDWPMTEQSLRDPTWNWPVEWLKRLVGELRQADKWPSEPVMFTNADPAAAIAPNSQFTSWIALRSMTDAVNAPDHRWIDIHSLFPIYPEEAEYARGHGAEALVQRFQEQGVALHIDPGRKSVC